MNASIQHWVEVGPHLSPSFALPLSTIHWPCNQHFSFRRLTALLTPCLMKYPGTIWEGWIPFVLLLQDTGGNMDRESRGSTAHPPSPFGSLSWKSEMPALQETFPSWRHWNEDLAQGCTECTFCAKAVVHTPAPLQAAVCVCDPSLSTRGKSTGKAICCNSPSPGEAATASDSTGFNRLVFPGSNRQRQHITALLSWKKTPLFTLFQGKIRIFFLPPVSSLGTDSSEESFWGVWILEAASELSWDLLRGFPEILISSS